MTPALDIQFDESELQAMGQQVENELNKELADAVKEENLKLQLAAIEFLQKAVEVVNLINNYNNLQKLQAQRRKIMQNPPVSLEQESIYEQTAQEIRTNYIEKQVFDEFFKAVMIFNDKVLEIITGAPMTTVIVVDGADGPEIREYTIQELLEADSGIKFITSYASKSNVLIGRIQINTSQLSKAISTVSELDQAKSNFSLIGLNIAYADAKTDYLNHLPTHYAFFKSPSEKVWSKIKITGGLGDISEAYTAFFFLKKPPFKDSRWANLATYFRQGVANVDAVSGLYAADIQDEENKRNYAIKAANASLPGYTQMIQLANNILDGSKQWNVAKLRQISEQKQYAIKNGEKIRKGLRNTIETAFDFIPMEV